MLEQLPTLPAGAFLHSNWNESIYEAQEDRRQLRIEKMSQDERHGGETDLRAIDKVRDAHVAALNAGDASACVADDGMQMHPNAPANIGKAQIGSWSHAFLNQFRVQFAFSVDEVRVLGEWAFETGKYTISLNPTAAGPAMQDDGKYITVYQRKTTDTWKMARDIWNSSNPSPKMWSTGASPGRRNFRISELARHFRDMRPRDGGNRYL
jgi:uncharacterized protein (TIGR02246 family)